MPRPTTARSAPERRPAHPVAPGHEAGGGGREVRPARQGTVHLHRRIQPGARGNHRPGRQRGIVWPTSPAPNSSSTTSPSPHFFATASYSYLHTRLDTPAGFYNFPAQPGFNIDGAGTALKFAAQPELRRSGRARASDQLPGQLQAGQRLGVPGQPAGHGTRPDHAGRLRRHRGDRSRPQQRFRIWDLLPTHQQRHPGIRPEDRLLQSADHSVAVHAECRCVLHLPASTTPRG